MASETVQLPNGTDVEIEEPPSPVWGMLLMSCPEQDLDRALKGNGVSRRLLDWLEAPVNNLSSLDVDSTNVGSDEFLFVGINLFLNKTEDRTLTWYEFLAARRPSFRGRGTYKVMDYE